MVGLRLPFIERKSPFIKWYAWGRCHVWTCFAHPHSLHSNTQLYYSCDKQDLSTILMENSHTTSLTQEHKCIFRSICEYPYHSQWFFVWWCLWVPGPPQTPPGLGWSPPTAYLYGPDIGLGKTSQTLKTNPQSLQFVWTLGHGRVHEKLRNSVTGVIVMPFFSVLYDHAKV